jgi:biopolymer transport protein ExbD
MSWKIRHEGSPRAIEGLTLPQVLDGLRDGLWEPTDEVLGPQDRAWTALERHPETADTAADLEPPPPPAHDDETRLDMNPLIDVALVLLIFFILTTTYQTMAKMLDMPDAATQQEKGLPVANPEQVRQRTVRVEVRRDGSGAAYFIEGKKVAEPDLVAELKRVMKETGKDELAIDADPQVPWKAVMTIQDKAKGAGATKAYHLVPVPAQP